MAKPVEPDHEVDRYTTADRRLFYSYAACGMFPDGNYRCEYITGRRHFAWTLYNGGSIVGTSTR